MERTRHARLCGSSSPVGNLNAREFVRVLRADIEYRSTVNDEAGIAAGGGEADAGLIIELGSDLHAITPHVGRVLTTVDNPASAYPYADVEATLK